MGCDIHMYVERRRTRFDGSKTEWFSADLFSIKDPCDPKCEPIRVDLWDERNYDLFAVLANVRNRSGNYKYPYIDEPRGIPDDATKYVRKEYDLWDIDAHSASYLTFREILEFYYEKTPKTEFGYDILNPLIERLKKRADEFNIIHSFDWNGGLSTKDLYDRADNIRIVFFFDN